MLAKVVVPVVGVLCGAVLCCVVLSCVGNDFDVGVFVGHPVNTRV